MIFVGTILFVLLWRGLGKWVFAPYIDLVEARERATSGAKENAKQLKSDAERITQEYEKRLFEARMEGTKEKLVILDNAKKQASTLIHKAEDEANKLTEDGKGVVTGQATQARGQAMADVEKLAQSLVENIRGRLLH